MKMRRRKAYENVRTKKKRGAHMTKKELLEIVQPLADDAWINLFSIAADDGYYILEAFTRENLEELGYDLSDVEDDTLYKMAVKHELDPDTIAALCEAYGIPEKNVEK